MFHLLEGILVIPVCALALGIAIVDVVRVFRYVKDEVKKKNQFRTE